MKDLHQEIGLFDRKIAYCKNHEHFVSEADRAAAVHKLEIKRMRLVKGVLRAAKEGVEFDPQYLPQSLVEKAGS